MHSIALVCMKIFFPYSLLLERQINVRVNTSFFLFFKVLETGAAIDTKSIMQRRKSVGRNDRKSIAPGCVAIFLHSSCVLGRIFYCVFIEFLLNFYWIFTEFLFSQRFSKFWYSQFSQVLYYILKCCPVEPSMRGIRPLRCCSRISEVVE